MSMTASKVGQDGVVRSAAAGALFASVATVALGGTWVRAGFNAVWAAPVVAAAVEDSVICRLRDPIVFPGLAGTSLGAMLLWWSEGDSSVILGAVVGLLVMAGWMVPFHLCSPHGLGFGDVKFGLLVGAGVGTVSPVGLLAVVLLALVLQLLVMASPVLPAQRNGLAAPGSAPFGPAMALAAVLFVVVVTGVRGGIS